jgi:hypothetical protein
MTTRKLRNKATVENRQMFFPIVQIASVERNGQYSFWSGGEHAVHNQFLFSRGHHNLIPGIGYVPEYDLGELLGNGTFFPKIKLERHWFSRDRPGHKFGQERLETTQVFWRAVRLERDRYHFAQSRIIQRPCTPSHNEKQSVAQTVQVLIQNHVAAFWSQFLQKHTTVHPTERRLDHALVFNLKQRHGQCALRHGYEQQANETTPTQGLHASITAVWCRRW